MLWFAGPAHAFRFGQDRVVISWLDQPPPNSAPENIVKQIVREDLDSWITPNDAFFVIKHNNLPELHERDWRLEIGGLVAHPKTLTLDDLKAWPSQETTSTIECSGNSAFPFNKGLVSNAAWAGVPLPSILDEAGVLEPGVEVVFWGGDAGEQTWRDMTITERFARSMSLADARSANNLLALPLMPPLPARHDRAGAVERVSIASNVAEPWSRDPRSAT